MNWNTICMDEIGGKQKTKRKERRDEYVRVDPKRDKKNDRKRGFKFNREAKREFE